MNVSDLGELSKQALRTVPPHSLEAEESLIAHLMLRPKEVDLIEDTLKPEHFYSDQYREIFRAILHLSEKGTQGGMVEVSNALEGNPAFKGNAVLFVAEVCTKAIPIGQITKVADIIRGHAIRRELIQVALDLGRESLEKRGDVEELISDTSDKIFQLSVASGNGDTILNESTLVDAAISEVRARCQHSGMVTGIPTGYYDLDHITTGLHPKELSIMAARPSMGKTALAINIGTRTAVKWGTPTLIFSLEMGNTQLVQRQLSSVAQVDAQSMRRGQLTKVELEKIDNAGKILATAPLYIDETPGLSTSEFRARSRRCCQQYGIGLIIIDYLQLMRSSRVTHPREQVIADISQTLKAVAKELGVHVMALSQLNRKIEDRPDPRPQLSDLRESGAIEQDADLIMFIHREKLPEDGKIHPAEIIIGKQRNGPVGTVNLGWAGRWTSFENLKP